MGAPRVETATSLAEFTTIVDTVRQTTTHPIWFRGIGSENYKLIPSLYRHPVKNQTEELIELEAELLTRFRHRSIPYQDRPIDDEWERLFMMQHFGVPTRLLDWSENPFIALYFAVTSAEQNMRGGAFTENAAIWILNTQVWNSKVLSPYWRGRILAVPDAPLEAYAPGIDLGKLSELPVAIAGLYNSPRIVAQRGAFTIFGHKNAPMEDIFDTNGFPPEALIKILLPTANLLALRESLFGIGYADSMIYPDLPGLAKEMKRCFGFGV